MSTVGYGDMSPITYFGRIFIMIFICIGLGMFATHIPFIMEYFSSQSEYHGSYKIAQGRKHIVLCGYITHDTVENFLRDFLHKDRADVVVNVVILGNHLPDPDLERTIKKHYVHVSYYVGTVLSADDCKRVKMSKADACLVLCNKNCSVPDNEDEENIMRVVGIKNFFPKMRVIIQLLQYHNKAYLLNIPSWDSKIGDDVVCVGELKLGFIAQSCLSPGFSTLLANIFSMRSNDLKGDDTTSDDDWRKWYVRGTNCELYTEKLAPSFKSLAFKQAAEICFEKLNLLLIAIEVTKVDGEKTFAINPKDKTLIIQGNTLGFFLAGSAQEVRRAFYYCTMCHTDITDPELIKECDCLKQGKPTKSLRFLVSEALPGLSLGREGHRTVWNVPIRERTDNQDEENPSRSEAIHQRLMPLSKKQGSYKVLSKLKAVVEESKKDESQVALLSTKPSLKENKPVESFDRSKPLFDVTGTFYWCSAVPYEEAILTKEKAYDIVFTHHILVCVFNKKDDPLIGLRQLVMPLRASNLQQTDLKHIVLLGDKDYLEREWEQIGSFDNIYILPGSPFCRSDLRAVNSNLADMVVFLSATTTSSFSSDPKLADKHSILASLNLKAMSFDDAAGLLSQSTREAFIGLPDVSLGSPNIQRRGSAFGCNIPMLTEIVFDHNVQYLDIDDDDDDDMELYLSQPFACGTTFTASVLDSLVSSTYYNGDILTLVRNLVTGGVNPVLEEQLAEGEGLKGGYEVSETSEIRCRCKISQISLYDGPLAEFGNGGQYGEMFLHALRDYSMICLGVYRFRDSNKLSSTPSSKRYVIAVPPYDFLLQSTDLVFVLAHSNDQLNKQFSKE
ncbi:calcium-activated potassium channel subunit alpha-1-like isoform X3 [Actinia tenebrosa]|uniref:Calcium-activated potassium channel subunit alpha-1-like isoform X3 n=1 Tax=Actinia tenebrosa TaxID=6105 RepID=A0A6P8J093_ACTTE|nr:calcium-activated potassium channel subunit alpha-1-like isoform X3 [Actinia tenebrosa]